MAQAKPAAPPPAQPADAGAYFDTLQRLVRELHTASHNTPAIPNQSRELIGLADGMIDMLDWLVNSASWSDRRLWRHDKALISRELQDKLLWRLGGND